MDGATVGPVLRICRALDGHAAGVRPGRRPGVRALAGTALVAVLTILGGLVSGRCRRLPASRSVIPGGGVGLAIAAMPEIAHRGIGLPLTTGNALAGWSPSVVEGV